MGWMRFFFFFLKKLIYLCSDRLIIFTHGHDLLLDKLHKFLCFCVDSFCLIFFIICFHCPLHNKISQALNFCCVLQLTEAGPNIQASDEENLELSIFDMVTISRATNSFCCINKIGEGGFGSVYKVSLFHFYTGYFSYFSG